MTVTVNDSRRVASTAQKHVAYVFYTIGDKDFLKNLSLLDIDFLQMGYDYDC